MSELSVFLILVMLSGSAFAFGSMLICKLFSWAPINIIVNINNGTAAGDESESLLSVGESRGSVRPVPPHAN